VISKSVGFLLNKTQEQELPTETLDVKGWPVLDMRALTYVLKEQTIFFVKTGLLGVEWQLPVNWADF
jgi:hypothetical protein